MKARKRLQEFLEKRFDTHSLREFVSVNYEKAVARISWTANLSVQVRELIDELSRRGLMDSLWGGLIIEFDNFTDVIAELRTAWNEPGSKLPSEVPEAVAPGVEDSSEPKRRKGPRWAKKSEIEPGSEANKSQPIFSSSVNLFGVISLNLVIADRGVAYLVSSGFRRGSLVDPVCSAP